MHRSTWLGLAALREDDIDIQSAEIDGGPRTMPTLTHAHRVEDTFRHGRVAARPRTEAMTRCMRAVALVAAVTIAGVLAACGGDDGQTTTDAAATGDAGPADAHALGPDGTPSPSVAEIADTACETSGVRGLALQIAATVQCFAPDALVPFAESTGLTFTGSNVVPYLVPSAALALTQAASAAAAPLQVNSAFRTIAEQVILKQWADAHRCGITVAAAPGRSNHESGRAVDLQNWAASEAVMNAHGWDRDVPGDDVHFEFLAGDDIRGLDVQAFQTLWNTNHPDDLIDVDGVYGPATERRLLASPSAGFGNDACPAARASRLANSLGAGDGAGLDCTQ